MAAVRGGEAGNFEAGLPSEEGRAPLEEVAQIHTALEAWVVERHNATPCQVMLA